MKYLLLLLLLPSIALAESVKFAWDPPLANQDGSPLVLTGYKLYISPVAGVYGPPVSTVPSTSKTYSFLVPANMSGTFFVTVTAYNSIGESARSNEISFVTKPKPSEASNLRVQP